MENIWEIFEDNGGGVYLAIMDQGKPVAIIENWECASRPGILRESLDDLASDPNTWRMWDGDLLQRLNDHIEYTHDPRGHWTIGEVYEDVSSGDLVAWRDAEGEHLRPDRMGYAARHALGLPEEDEEND